MSYIDSKYLNILSPQLLKFQKKGDYLWNFRCPYCGDSQKSRSKARGFVYRKKNDLFYKCHNCGIGATLGNLIKYLDSKIHKDYIMERYQKGVKTNNPEPEFKFDVPVFRKKGILKDLKSIASLPEGHPAKKIIKDRLIPSKSLADLYLCESFYKFTNTLIPNKFPSLDGDHPRLLIPFRDEEGEVFAYQGRAFGNEQPKYLTIKLNESKNKIFGLDRINKEKQIYVVEGPIDSLFLDNCIAVAGSDLNKIEGDLTIIFDNEPRNREIVKQIEKVINSGRNIVLWPDSMKYKDINDMILGGYSKSEIQQIIMDNTFSGVEAKLRFTEWKKIDERTLAKTI
tara:strand:+ start:1074 stop:2093 length:1020 start_codon:yes stop_codon:yes gene_type:complete